VLEEVVVLAQQLPAGGVGAAHAAGGPSPRIKWGKVNFILRFIPKV
jgi:hypothetical protein